MAFFNTSSLRGCLYERWDEIKNETGRYTGWCYVMPIWSQNVYHPVSARQDPAWNRRHPSKDGTRISLQMLLLEMICHINTYRAKSQFESQWLEGYCRNTTFFPNRAARARRWSLNRESTLIGGGRHQIVCDGRYFSILFFLEGLGQTIVLSFCSSKANTNVSNIAGFLSLQ